MPGRPSWRTPANGSSTARRVTTAQTMFRYVCRPSRPTWSIGMPETPETWRWDEGTWRGHVQRVRAGRSLAPATWPNEARVAVALSFDADHETIPLRDAETRPGKLSQGEYGA